MLTIALLASLFSEAGAFLLTGAAKDLKAAVDFCHRMLHTGRPRLISEFDVLLLFCDQLVACSSNQKLFLPQEREVEGANDSPSNHRPVLQDLVNSNTWSTAKARRQHELVNGLWPR